ncbi:hypothetical protein ABT354_16710 [Streptomyces sp. NPDC000594]|uniref:WXG100 family type VII secretion target n=1 Tax=Streptomyces sp. NPDC000594 TaxID=3154261 RepID=UPI00331781AF
MAINADYDGDGFISNTEAMQGSMEAIIAAANRTNEVITTLNSDIHPTLTAWQSEDPTDGAKPVFEDCQRRWNAAMEELQRCLGGAGEVVGNVAQIYKSGDRKAAQIMAG